MAVGETSLGAADRSVHSAELNRSPPDRSRGPEKLDGSTTNRSVWLKRISRSATDRSRHLKKVDRSVSGCTFRVGQHYCRIEVPLWRPSTTTEDVEVGRFPPWTTVGETFGVCCRCSATIAWTPGARCVAKTTIACPSVGCFRSQATIWRLKTSPGRGARGDRRWWQGRGYRALFANWPSLRIAPAGSAKG